MKDKDKVLKIVISILTIVFGVLLLLDQLEIKYINEFFEPWWLILILYFVGWLFAHAIVKKAPVFYIFAMTLAGIYLVIAIHFKVESINYTKILFIIPLFFGLGCIIADVVCKWMLKARRFGLVTTIASTLILISVILGVWKIVIPVVVILIGIAYMAFSIFDAQKSSVVENDDHYVTYEENQSQEHDDETIDNKNINSVDD